MKHVRAKTLRLATLGAVALTAPMSFLPAGWIRHGVTTMVLLTICTILYLTTFYLENLRERLDKIAEVTREAEVMHAARRIVEDALTESLRRDTLDA